MSWPSVVYATCHNIHLNIWASHCQFLKNKEEDSHALLTPLLSRMRLDLTAPSPLCTLPMRLLTAAEVESKVRRVRRALRVADPDASFSHRPSWSRDE